MSVLAEKKEKSESLIKKIKSQLPWTKFNGLKQMVLDEIIYLE